MSDYDITRIKNAILNKKNSIIWNEIYIDDALDNSSDMKRRLKNSYIPANNMIKVQIKNDIAKSKKQKKEMRINIKELKIYEAEYKKKLNDPNYRIDFNLLIKKHNKNNIKI